MKFRILILVLLSLSGISAAAQTPHALATGTTSLSVTLANQTTGGTNFVFVSWCPSACSTGTTLNLPVTLTDSAGDTYTSVYRTDGPSSNQLFIAPASASTSNVLSVSIPASSTSVVMASEIPGAWTLDTAANTGDLIYAAFIGADARNYLAGSGYTTLNAGQWWTDEFSITNLTPTFVHTGATANPTFSVPFKPAGPPPPFVWVMPGLGTATFPMNIPPACGPSDGTCSIQIQVCDTSKTPPVCMVSSQGTITLLKNITLPTPQQQAIPLVTVTP